MKRIIFIVLAILFLFGISFKNVVAANSATADPKTLSTYELFWPLVAGKAMDDPLYFIKNIKEQLQSLFTFGSAEKADYEVLLATKRIIEADELIGKGKIDLAGKTLMRSQKSLDKAFSLIEKAKSDEDSFRDQAINMSNRLSNLEVFIPRLIEKDAQDKEILTRILGKVTLFKTKL